MMKEDITCAICLRHGLDEDAPVLTFSPYGVPRCLCPVCSEKVESAMRGESYEEIAASVAYIAENISDKNIDDKCTVDAVTELLKSSKDRAERIREGTWDFSVDEKKGDEELEDIPEELLETEEDRQKDKRDKEISKKFDRVMNWVLIAIALFAVGYVIFSLLP